MSAPRDLRPFASAFALAVLGCSKPAASVASDDGGPDTDSDVDVVSDVVLDTAPEVVLPPYARTLVTRPLMPTSPSNLLRDPFIGGDGKWSFGQFHAYYLGGASIPIHRTFVSTSPIGGAVTIEELRDLPSPGTSTKARVTASFIGGPGAFHASIWLSPGDASSAPVPYSTVAASISVALLSNDGTGAAPLTPTGEPHLVFGAREWVHYATTGDVALAAGGWLSVELSALTATLQLAAPEVTSSALGDAPTGKASTMRAMTDDDRRAITQGRASERSAPERPSAPPLDDR